MPLLISGGDSFTWGSELGDDSKKSPSNFTWSALLAKKLNYDYKCVAKPGGSNVTICRKILEAIKETNNSEELSVVVMWSYTHRSELRLRQIPQFQSLIDNPMFEVDDYYLNFNAWHGLSLDEKLAFFTNGVSEDQYKFFKDQHDTLTELGITSAADQFYKITGDTISHHINAAKEIVLLQSILESKKIPYFFCSSTNELFDTQHPKVLDNFLWKNINWNKWYKEIGFHRWSQQNNYHMSGNHPGREAHRDWLDLSYTKIIECLQN